MSGLKYTVVVRHPETLEPVALLKGEPVPKWAADLVQPEDVGSGAGDTEGKQPRSSKPDSK